MWKIEEKLQFFLANTAWLGKYCTGAYGLNGVYRVNYHIQCTMYYCHSVTSVCWNILVRPISNKSKRNYIFGQKCIITTILIFYMMIKINFTNWKIISLQTWCCIKLGGKDGTNSNGQGLSLYSEVTNRGTELLGMVIWKRAISATSIWTLGCHIIKL